MSIKTLAELKAKFETGDQPTGADFVDLIDSFLHAQLGNFPNPLPAVSGAALTNIGSALPDPLPARDGSQLYNINPQEYNIPGAMPVPSYATATTFVLNDDWTSGSSDPAKRLLLLGRRIRLTIGGNYFYTEIQNAVYAAGITTGTVADAMPGSPIQACALGIITPFAVGGAVGQTIIGLGRGTAIASAASLNVGAAGDMFHVTGTTGPITSITARPPGHEISLVFDSTPDMTHNGTSLILPGAVNQKIAANSVFNFRSEGSGNWICTGITHAAGNKPLTKDHGTQGGNYTLQLDEAEMHMVAFSAVATLTIASRRTVDRALVVVKNGGFAITLAGIDNDSPTLTNAATRQDFIALAKSFGKISALSAALNKVTT